ncbi:MAG: FKBP-type peptidyl-prolyl cis-trans isomerase N-terminal domain-containing protein [Planctomycetota bacterium]
MQTPRSRLSNGWPGRAKLAGLFLVAAAVFPAGAQDAPESPGTSPAASADTDRSTAATAPASRAAPATQPSFSRFEERSSYVVGRQLGQGMRALGIELDPAALRQGLADADRLHRGAEAAHMDDARFQQAVAEYAGVLRSRTLDAEQQAQQQQVFSNSAASDAFLGRFAQQPGVQRLEPGVFYRELRPGSGPAVQPGQLAKLRITGRLPDGPVFLDTRDRGAPAEFRVDPDRLPAPGWYPALTNMRVGAVWDIALPADQAFGDLGLPELGVGPAQALRFELEVLEVEPSELVEPAGGADPHHADPHADHDHGHGHDHDHDHGHAHPPATRPSQEAVPAPAPSDDQPDAQPAQR